MRATIVALVLVSACRVADVHFIGSGGGDDAHLDGHDDAPMMPIDAPFAVAGHGYLVDRNAGVFLLAMSANGDAAFTGNVVSGPAYSIAINRAAKRLYMTTVTSPPLLHTYAIQPDGTLVHMPPDQGLPCSTGDIALAPNGNMLALGCVNNSTVVTYLIDGQGLPSAQNTQQAGFALSPSVVVFGVGAGAGGSCLFVGDTSPPAGGPTLYAFQVDPNTGAMTMLGGGTAGPAVLALATNPQGNVVYAAGPGSLRSLTTGNQCNIGNPATAVTSQMPQAMTVDPLGKNLFVTGSEVYSYSITAGNAQPNNGGSPYLPSTQAITGATLDGMGTNLYLTSAGYSGVQHAQVTATGAVSALGSPTSSPLTPNARMFLLGP